MTANKPKQLIDILQTMVDLSTQFNELLLKEKKALENSNSELLLDVSTAKKSLAIRLEHSTKTAHTFLNNIKLNKGLYGLGDFIKRMKPSDSQRQLTQHWLDIQSLTEANKQLNDANGAIIELNRRHAQRSIDILHGHTGNNNSATYGADGQAMKKRAGRKISVA
ncbi:MAG: flagellar protein FlgN [Cycloclasticus sp.]|jgi:FlgN protein.|nr:hypothetical protein A9Q80_06905 [Cycloclasticus sp. 46_83_sub15_T18]